MNVAAAHRRAQKKAFANIEFLYDGRPDKEEAMARARASWETEYKATLTIYARMKEITAELYPEVIRLTTNVYAVTIRPPDGSDFGIFKQQVNCYIQSKTINQYEYSYEQTGESEDNLGHGFHVHMCIWSNLSPSHMIRDAVAKFIGCQVKIGNDFSKKLHTQKDLNQWRNYIRGDKHNESKDPAVLMNTLWRTEQNLDDLYSTQGQGNQLIKYEK